MILNIPETIAGPNKLEIIKAFANAEDLELFETDAILDPN